MCFPLKVLQIFCMKPCKISVKTLNDMNLPKNSFGELKKRISSFALYSIFVETTKSVLKYTQGAYLSQ